MQSVVVLPPGDLIVFPWSNATGSFTLLGLYLQHTFILGKIQHYIFLRKEISLISKKPLYTKIVLFSHANVTA